jgi:hypothetical protein
MVICIENGCKISACFNFENENPAKYCKKHKKENMIDVVHQKCDICKIKRPNFNYDYETKGLYCSDCKLENMIDVKNRKCDICKLKLPCFNYDYETKGLYCSDCKLENMIDVKNRKCDICKIKRPSFNYDYETKALYCSDCKLENMIDITHRKCDICKIKHPCFNYENETVPLYCADCKLENMIDIKSKKCEKCNINLASHNYENETIRLYCSDCKLENMVNVKHKKCIECKSIFVSKKYEYHCLRCYIYKFPDNNISRNFKVKERYVTDFIKDEFPNQFIFDKVIDGGCSKRRPDAFKDCETHTLIIEVDEYQHKNYEEICENKRMMEIFKDLDNRPIVFIRFNPDDYINENNKKIKSCFDMNIKLDVPYIKNKEDWLNRLDKLKRSIEYNLDNIPQKLITIVYLYFNKNNDII